MAVAAISMTKVVAMVMRSAFTARQDGTLSPPSRPEPHQTAPRLAGCFGVTQLLGLHQSFNGDRVSRLLVMQKLVELLGVLVPNVPKVMRWTAPACRSQRE